MMQDKENKRNDQIQHSKVEEGAQKQGTPKVAGMRSDEERNPDTGNKPAEGQLAADPSMRHEDIAPPSATPSEKKEPSALPGVDAEGPVGNVQSGAGAAGGTKGAGTSSEGRKGDPDNYGNNQAGAGMATGPVRGKGGNNNNQNS